MRCAKGDIEDLDAVLPCDSDQLTVEYDVDIDHAQPGEFDLVVDVINNGERIHSFVIALDSPNDSSHHECEYKACITETLPMVISERCKLKVEGNIIARSGAPEARETVSSSHGPSLDKKVRSVDIEDSPGFASSMATESWRFVSYPVRAIGGESY